MKLNGQGIGAPDPLMVVFERGENKFVFHVQAVFDFGPFNELCPKPNPGKSLRKGIVKDESYRKRLENWNIKRGNWGIIKALEATEGLEWEVVDLDKPDTWEKFEDELLDAGLTRGEIAYLLDTVTRANTVSDAAMEDARDRFIAGQEAQD